MAGESEKSRCLRAYRAGVPVNELADRFGVTRRTISRWVKEGLKEPDKGERPLRRMWRGGVYSPLYRVSDRAFGRALGRMMERAGIGAAEMHERTGLAESTVRGLVKGDFEGNIATWQTIAYKGLHCTIADIEREASDA